MFKELLYIKNYKLFVVNMLLLGMGIAVTVPYLVLFATKDLGMTTKQYGLLLALAAISQFTVNSIIARFSDTNNINRKFLIITALFMGAISFSIYFFVKDILLFIILSPFFKDCLRLQCLNFMHPLENRLMFQALVKMPNLPIQF